MQVTSQEVMAELRNQFPELIEDLDDECWKGLLHLEIATLARKAEASISDGDEIWLRRSYDFANWAFRSGDMDVKNAIYVSFLENLTFTDSKKRRRTWAFEMLPEPLQVAHRELMDHLDQLRKLSKKQ